MLFQADNIHNCIIIIILRSFGLKTYHYNIHTSKEVKYLDCHSSLYEQMEYSNDVNWAKWYHFCIGAISVIHTFLPNIGLLLYVYMAEGIFIGVRQQKS